MYSLVLLLVRNLLREDEFERVAHSEFSIVKECVLREGQWTEKTLNDWFDATNGDKSAIESVVNHAEDEDRHFRLPGLYAPVCH
jgi:hypothetical protein